MSILKNKTKKNFNKIKKAKNLSNKKLKKKKKKKRFRITYKNKKKKKYNSTIKLYKKAHRFNKIINKVKKKILKKIKQLELEKIKNKIFVGGDKKSKLLLSVYQIYYKATYDENDNAKKVNKWNQTFGGQGDRPWFKEIIEPGLTEAVTVYFDYITKILPDRFEKDWLTKAVEVKAKLLNYLINNNKSEKLTKFQQSDETEKLNKEVENFNQRAIVSVMFIVKNKLLNIYQNQFPDEIFFHRLILNSDLENIKTDVELEKKVNEKKYELREKQHELTQLQKKYKQEQKQQRDTLAKQIIEQNEMEKLQKNIEKIEKQRWIFPGRKMKKIKKKLDELRKIQDELIKLQSALEKQDKQQKYTLTELIIKQNVLDNIRIALEKQKKNQEQKTVNSIAENSSENDSENDSDNDSDNNVESNLKKKGDDNEVKAKMSYIRIIDSMEPEEKMM